MPVKYFEELEVWKEARQLTREVYRLTSDSKFSKDFGLSNQIQRAAVSIMSNIAEGFERGGNPEFIQFLYVAKGSCGETRFSALRGTRSGIHRAKRMRGNGQIF